MSLSLTIYVPPSLLQVQATVVGFLAAVAAVVLGWIPEGKFQMSHAVLLCSSSVATAFIASLLQGRKTRTPCWNYQNTHTFTGLPLLKSQCVLKGHKQTCCEDLHSGLVKKIVC